MIFEQSDLSVDDYFGCRDLVSIKPQAPRLISSNPTLEQVEEYKEALKVYEYYANAYEEAETNRNKIRGERSAEFIQYFCEHVNLPKDYPQNLKLSLIRYCQDETDTFEGALCLGSELEKFINWKPQQ